MLFFVLRLCLTSKLVLEQMVGGKLAEEHRLLITNQAENLICYYFQRYMYLIDTMDGGITPRMTEV